jgi:malate synthase
MNANSDMNYIEASGLKIAAPLYELVRDSIVPGTGIDPINMWESFAKIIRELTPVNEALLAKRVELQELIDQWHRGRRRFPDRHTARRCGNSASCRTATGGAGR